MNARFLRKSTNDSAENQASQNDATKEGSSDGSALVPVWSVESASRILAGLTETHRAPIAEAFKARGGRFAATFDRNAKAAMADAIFVGVENALEHAQGNIPPHRRTVVNDLRARRNALLDAIGENERRA